MKYPLLLTLTLALAACGESAGIYNIEFTTVYSDHYVLAVHAQGSRLDHLDYRAAGDSSSRMPFTTFFRYDSNGLAEIYTRDREGNRTLNYQANSENIWPLVFVAIIQGRLREGWANRSRDGSLRYWDPQACPGK